MNARTGSGRLLNTYEARREFCAQYKDQLYELALSLTHEAKPAGYLVVHAFRRAFERYAATPSPPDSLPYLTAAIYLLFAQGAEQTEPFLAVPAAPRRAQKATQARQESRSAQPDAPKEHNPAGVPPVVEYVTDARDAPPDPDTEVFPRGERAHPPEQAQRSHGAQPLSEQVFDPKFTAFWTPELEQVPESAAQNPTESAKAAHGQPEKAAWEESAGQPAQPKFSNAYMYDERIAKKRKSRVMRIINAILFLLLVWFVIGLLMHTGVLPQLNLGYTWFNLYIYPLF